MLTQIDRAAMRRDLVWALLWELTTNSELGGWATSSSVWRLWLNGRGENGIAWADDFIGPRDGFTRSLNELVAAGRAEKRKQVSRHPTYRAVPPVLS